MNLWVLKHSTHMATSFVRWWRNKFLVVGYKPFPEFEDGKMSDTEELLEKLHSKQGKLYRLENCYENPREERSFDITVEETNPISKRTSCEIHSEERCNGFKEERSSGILEETQKQKVTEELSTQTSIISTSPVLVTQESSQVCPQVSSNEDKQYHYLGLDTYPYDLPSSQPEGEASKKKRQEFSFTLYDFDGHGKITKDDIAGLVTTIYEALGSSVKVPHYGSKTIKVRVSVSPEQKNDVNSNDKSEKSSEKNSHSSKCSHKKADYKSKDYHHKKYNRSRLVNRKSKNHCCKKHYPCELDELYYSDGNSDVSSRISGVISSEEDEEAKKNISFNANQENFVSRSSNSTNDRLESGLEMNKLKTRSGSIQRQELVDIIQANMEKNNLSFNTPKKPHHHRVGFEATLAEIKQKCHSKPTSKEHSSSLQHYLANIVEPTHMYVDMATLQNQNQIEQENCTYADAVVPVCKKNYSNKSKYYNNKAQNNFSDVPVAVRYPVVDYSLAADDISKNGIRKHKRNEDKFKDFKPHQVPHGHTPTSHYWKHRNRHNDQSRAMEQVVRWLEQEFDSNLSTKKEKQEKTKENHHGSNSKSSHKRSTRPPKNSPGVGRHEHHHVHQHIHHHYHHFQESAFVV